MVAASAKAPIRPNEAGTPRCGGGGQRRLTRARWPDAASLTSALWFQGQASLWHTPSGCFWALQPPLPSSQLQPHPCLPPMDAQTERLAALQLQVPPAASGAAAAAAEDASGSGAGGGLATIHDIPDELLCRCLAEAGRQGG